MKWNRYGLWFLSSCLLLCGLTFASGCTSIEQIRKASQEISLNTKALVDIEGAKKPENKDIADVITALEKGLGSIPKPDPFKIPVWIEWAIYILLGSNILQGTKISGQMLSGIGKMLGKGKS